MLKRNTRNTMNTRDAIDAPSKKLAYFRSSFGLFLMWHFEGLVVYGEELFGKEMPYDPSLGPTHRIFPGPFEYVAPPAFLVGLCLISVSFTLGICERLSALLLWYGWAALLNRNVYINNPGVAYVGWLLLVFALVPPNNRQLKENMLYLAWFLMALGYTVSGLHKLQSPSWVDGSALRHILDSPLGRNNIVTTAILSAPDVILRFATWGSLALEILFLPLGLFKHTRKFFWVAYMFFHLGILATVNFADLTVTVLMIHLFTFDSTWIPWYAWKTHSQQEVPVILNCY